MLPFDTEMFEYTPNPNEDGDVSDGVLLAYPVVIATVHANGPIPTAFIKHSACLASPGRKLNDDIDFVDRDSYGTCDSCEANPPTLITFL